MLFRLQRVPLEENRCGRWTDCGNAFLLFGARSLLHDPVIDPFCTHTTTVQAQHAIVDLAKSAMSLTTDFRT